MVEVCEGHQAEPAHVIPQPREVTSQIRGQADLVHRATGRDRCGYSGVLGIRLSVPNDRSFGIGRVALEEQLQLLLRCPHALAPTHLAAGVLHQRSNPFLHRRMHAREVSGAGDDVELDHACVRRIHDHVAFPFRTGPSGPGWHLDNQQRPLWRTSQHRLARTAPGRRPSLHG